MSLHSENTCSSALSTMNHIFQGIRRVVSQTKISRFSLHISIDKIFKFMHFNNQVWWARVHHIEEQDDRTCFSTMRRFAVSLFVCCILSNSFYTLSPKKNTTQPSKSADKLMKMRPKQILIAWRQVEEIITIRAATFNVLIDLHRKSQMRRSLNPSCTSADHMKKL